MLLKVNAHKELLNKPFRQRIGSVSWLTSVGLLGCHGHVLCQSLAFLKQQLDIYVSPIFICRIYICIYVCMWIFLDAWITYVCVYVYIREYIKHGILFPVFQSDLCSNRSFECLFCLKIFFQCLSYFSLFFFFNSRATFPKRFLYFWIS